MKPVSRHAALGFNPKGVSGLQSRRLQTLRAGKFRAANRGRRLDAAERQAVENQMRQEGRI